MGDAKGEGRVERVGFIAGELRWEIAIFKSDPIVEGESPRVEEIYITN